MKKKLIIYLFLWATLKSFGQNPNWIVYNTSNSELPNNGVLSIAIDSFDIKWIGTVNGLSKFDNHYWTIYTPSNTPLLYYGTIHSICIDAENKKWLGTMSLNIFDDLNWFYYEFRQSGALDIVNTIMTDQNNAKWMGTNSTGLIKFADTNWTFYNSSNSGLLDNHITALHIDKYGNKWIGTAYNGIFKFDGTAWVNYNNTNSGLPNDLVLEISSDENDNKWIGTLQSGLVVFDGTDWTIYNTSNSDLPNNCVSSIVIDRQNNKWIGSSNANLQAGLVKYDGLNWIIYNISNSGLPSNQIFSIVIDKFNNKWIGTGQGLAVFNEEGIISSVEETILIREFSLSQNYPNPFNPSTKIKYSIPASLNPSEGGTLVSLKIYDLLGREVATLVNEEKQTGYYEIEFNGNNLPSGVYYYQLKANKFVETKKMILLR